MIFSIEDAPFSLYLSILRRTYIKERIHDASVYINARASSVIEHWDFPRVSFTLESVDQF